MTYEQEIIDQIIELSKEIGKNEHILDNSEVPVYEDTQMDILGEETEEKMREVEQLKEQLLTSLENKSSAVASKILRRIFESHLSLTETTYKIVKIIKEIKEVEQD